MAAFEQAFPILKMPLPDDFIDRMKVYEGDEVEPGHYPTNYDDDRSLASKWREERKQPIIEIPYDVDLDLMSEKIGRDASDTIAGNSDYSILFFPPGASDEYTNSIFRPQSRFKDGDQTALGHLRYSAFEDEGRMGAGWPYGGLAPEGRNIGLGPASYSLAAALTPDTPLMSDYSLTPTAERMWNRARGDEDERWPVPEWSEEFLARLRELGVDI